MWREEKKMKGKEKPSKLECMGKRRPGGRRLSKPTTSSWKEEVLTLQTRTRGKIQSQYLLAVSAVTHSKGSPRMAGLPLQEASPQGGSSETLAQGGRRGTEQLLPLKESERTAATSSSLLLKNLATTKPNVQRCKGNATHCPGPRTSAPDVKTGRDLPQLLFMTEETETQSSNMMDGRQQSGRPELAPGLQKQCAGLTATENPEQGMETRPGLTCPH